MVPLKKIDKNSCLSKAVSCLTKTAVRNARQQRESEKKKQKLSALQFKLSRDLWPVATRLPPAAIIVKQKKKKHKKTHKNSEEVTSRLSPDYNDQCSSLLVFLTVISDEKPLCLIRIELKLNMQSILADLMMDLMDRGGIRRMYLEMKGHSSNS